MESFKLISIACRIITIMMAHVDKYNTRKVSTKSVFRSQFSPCTKIGFTVTIKFHMEICYT